ncbi:MAG: DUF188 domain-containing protein [Candidatus Krumholzibacteriia bacterium]
MANSFMRVPSGPWLELVVVDQGLDEADDVIVERVAKDDIVITGDIPLAARCLDEGAHAGHKGRPFTRENVGGLRQPRSSCATRGIMMGVPGTVREEGSLAVPATARPAGQRDQARLTARRPRQPINI